MSVTSPAAAMPMPERASARTVLGFVCMVVGMFMAILDIQIVSSSIAEIQAGLSAGPDEISWVQTSYLVAEVVMIPLSGYLSRLLSTRWLFVLSAGSFTLMSAVCAMATDLNTMIVARALQGFLGGAMIPTVFAFSYTVFPPQQRNSTGVVIGLIATLAPTIGPTIGGYITEALSWHWLFLINLVPGAFVTVMVWALVDVDRPNLNLLRNFDGLGLAAMAVFLGCLEYVLEEGTRNDWLADETIRACAVLATLGGLLFFWRAFTHRNPIVDLRVFADRNFAAGAAVGGVVGIGLYGLVYLLPLFLGRARHLNAEQIGEIMFVTGATQFLVAPIVGRLSRNLDPRIMIAFGLTLLAASTWQLTAVTHDSQFWELLVPQICRGAALMLCMIPANVMALGTLPPSQVKNAAGLYNLMRNLGGALGLAGINTLLTDRTNQHWSRLVEFTSPGRPEVQSWLDAMATRLGDRLPGDADAMAVKRLGEVVMREATVQAFADVFWIMTVLFAAVLLTIPLVKRPAMQPSGGH